MFDEIHALQAMEQDAARVRLGEILNLEGPAPTDVLRRVGEDQKYMQYLVMLRDAPRLQRPLIDGVRKGWEPSQEALADEAEAQAELPSSAALAVKATKAFAKWGATGFRKIEHAEFEARWAACQACPNFKAPPDRVIYQGMKMVSSQDNNVCGLCGCTAKSKARMPTETCPGTDPNDPTRTRWGQPLKTAEGQTQD